MPEGSPQSYGQRQPGGEEDRGDALDDIARIDVVRVQVTVIEANADDMETGRLEMPRVAVPMRPDRSQQTVPHAITGFYLWHEMQTFACP
ncbi:hypothetical protein EAH87_15070 [Sphingomonas koreensis]|nr:hypothetical protein EAH87_15070 [Sphingomonas koreensis]